MLRDVAVGYIYNINWEFIVYIASFCAIFWVIAIAIAYFKYKDLNAKHSDDRQRDILDIYVKEGSKSKCEQ